MKLTIILNRIKGLLHNCSTANLRLPQCAPCLTVQWRPPHFLEECLWYFPQAFHLVSLSSSNTRHISPSQQFLMDLFSLNQIQQGHYISRWTQSTPPTNIWLSSSWQFPQQANSICLLFLPMPTIQRTLWLKACFIVTPMGSARWVIDVLIVQDSHKILKQHFLLLVWVFKKEMLFWQAAP